ncbi:hypothetical protein J5H37_19550 [Stenotrophomonas maltophilia]|jgi:hypothetical protein|uniref:hypothetical protein n=1 Tax=Stenotrophomonas maltophilia group TaxID=995085 RepID=UPI0015C56A38|nr:MULTISPECIES: hypothetical protein [Stenotrophomonas maltophilia group]MBN7831941.1 hypothetical protein [Stenotrophomonas maltophilia]MBN7835971.1 hypothetical protein [Stenotrophomonas maltophilia]MBN7860116.1 hypothetical protein [Stenotrophomonas maltophilia]MBN7918855.1 hypothetical protein [Stenotrophomonas maltophilia]MBO2847472.1 hypothetical protein [Stenotrophomonas maltophilia]
MSTHEHDCDHDLLARLRALPNERDVPADGWARLSARLPPREPEAAPAPTGNVVALATRSRRRWWLPAGAVLAASLAIYAVTPWRHVQPDIPVPSTLQLQAAAMTEQYRQAVAALPAGRAPEWQPALHELDESAAQIQAALAQDPRAPHLLGQLKRTYALRLELTRQAAYAAESGLTT